ncbi:MAG: hypothetical protein SOZ07_03605 [Prevotella sp.]|nr:hypothetical protein [Prevotella sp.]MDD7273394.1 hypothetical protein [Prevotellaceae bacterium]MDY3935730.1 hypothetical protein [Prevotella sp.]
MKSKIFCIFAVALLMLAGVGCSRKMVVPIERTTTDTIIRLRIDSIRTHDTLIVTRTAIVRDTLLVHDSIVITLTEAGEEKMRYVYRNIERTRTTDNTEAVRQTKDQTRITNDSTAARHAERTEVPIMIEKPLPWYKRALQTLGALLVVVVVLIAVVPLARFIVSWIRFKRK